MKTLRFGIPVLLAVLVAAGCGGKGARGDGDKEAIILTGKAHEQGSSPFAQLVFTTDAGKAYFLESSSVADELRSLDNMRLEVIGVVVDMLDDVPVLDLDSYTILALPSGDRPVVGQVLVKSQQGVTQVVVMDDSHTLWLVKGDFTDVLRGFRGAKVWVAGLSSGVGDTRTIHVSDYGVIRP